jgi:hypothetical protein
MRHACHYSGSEEVEVVWRATVVVRSAVRAVVHCHSLDELEETKINSDRGAAQRRSA